MHYRQGHEDDHGDGKDLPEPLIEEMELPRVQTPGANLQAEKKIKGDKRTDKKLAINKRIRDSVPTTTVPESCC